MCAQFGMLSDIDIYSGYYEIKKSIEIEGLLNNRYLPYSKAPVILADEKGKPQAKAMNFSLVPSWSKTPRVKFATHNARFESISEKPTWKKPFVRQRCLVPMTYFVEPIYEAEYAGHMVKFFEKSNAFLTAAGIWDQWMDKETGEIIESFSIITDEPPDFIDKMGHDRCPIFLKKESMNTWIEPNEKPAAELKDFLNSERCTPEFGIEKDRPMRPGWEKRK